MNDNRPKLARASKQQKRDALEEATRFAREATKAEQRRREEKTERLRTARLQARAQDRQV